MIIGTQGNEPPGEPVVRFGARPKLRHAVDRRPWSLRRQSLILPHQNSPPDYPFRPATGLLNKNHREEICPAFEAHVCYCHIHISVFQSPDVAGSGTVPEPAALELNFLLYVSAMWGFFPTARIDRSWPRWRGTATAQFRPITLRWIGSAITYMKWMVGTRWSKSGQRLLAARRQLPSHTWALLSSLQHSDDQI